MSVGAIIFVKTIKYRKWIVEFSMLRKTKVIKSKDFIKESLLRQKFTIKISGIRFKFLPKKSILSFINIH